LPWGSICKIIGCHPPFDLDELLDVRPALEYAQGHIAGARSISVDELESRLLWGSKTNPSQNEVKYLAVSG
jgi:rhodanese-related sulfurtransferase